MIGFEGVSYAYPTPEDGFVALRDVDVTLEAGESVAVVGPNGSGKSTFARLCDGLLMPSEGTVTVDGLDTSDEETVWDVRERVALVMQDADTQIVGTSVETDVAFGPENLGLAPEAIRERVASSLEAVGLHGYGSVEPHLLSEGRKHLLAVAGALAMRPSYLVADEPTAMLDPVSRSRVLRLLDRLAEEGLGIVLVTQRVEEAVRADRVIAFLEGRVIADGAPEDVLADVRAVEALGLYVPPLWRLADRLREAGVRLGGPDVTPAEVVGALWP